MRLSGRDDASRAEVIWVLARAFVGELRGGLDDGVAVFVEEGGRW